MAGMRALSGWMFGGRLSRVAPLALAAAVGVAGAAAAQSTDYSSHSQVDPSGGASVVDDGTASSSASLDAANYARSFIKPGTSTMGAIAATDGSARPFTMTTHQDSWFFNCGGPNVCESVPLSNPIPLALSFGINVSETQVTGSAYLEFDANYQLQTGGQFNFSFVQDGQGDFELTSNYVTSGGDRIDLPVVQTLSGGVWSLSVNATVHDQVCGLSYACIPEAMSCPAVQSCSSPPAFTDYQSIKAEIDPSQGETDVVDGYDPFSLNIVSLDPNYQFVSADGRSTAPTGGVPEPASWAMMLAGFLGIGAALRTRRSLLAA